MHCSFLTRTDTSHVVFVAVVFFDDRSRVGSRPYADPRAPILITLVASNDRAGTLADPNTGPNIRITDIIDHGGTGIGMPNASVEVLKANVFLD